MKTNEERGHVVFLSACSSAESRARVLGATIGADLENGIFGMKQLPQTSFLAAFVKGKAGHFNIRAGDAQKPGSLQTVYDGKRPYNYEVMKKQGGIVLGIGGDNSPWASGVFYEGVMTVGYAPDAVDEAVMANLVTAGYEVPAAGRG